ncbi:MAG: 3-phosphoserine/phosphohydroxythreonine transaminase [Chitinivibrionales bacterium]|nr:3-phosphoserine/phosphohydroxythreonine transaminase [Chitinivibrionales bacterium]MBD3358522.1 3-phosphoserine/phosphohydroxythreonine transaminase [Chitinivibrionales bacterium]
MARVYNFSAGPAALPLPVLEKAAAEMTDYRGTGMSVMEMSHRSQEYSDIIETARDRFRRLMDIPDNYHVLFLQGGASSQFAMVPLNLFSGGARADYVNTGAWSKKAIAEAKRWGDVNVVASSEDKTFSYIPKLERDMFSPDAAYVHITLNNTIYGTRYTKLPSVGNIPLVTDASSCILSERIDVSKFGIIYAGAQKNIGPAGVTLVVVREDLVGDALEATPTMFRYATHVKAGSMFNTPPTYAIYLAGLVFEWLEDRGGISAIEEVNKRKAALLYDFLDSSSLFKGTAATEDRSLMNVPFVLPTEELNATFIKQAAQNGLVTLKGHRSVGGMRASIYNAMPLEGVEKLVAFMKKFETENA